MAANRARIAGFTVGLCLVSVVLAAPAARAEDAFARITGPLGMILGDQPAIAGITNSANTIQIFSTLFGLANTITDPVGGAVSRPVAQPVTLVKRFDRASPRLLQAAFVGELLTVEVIWYMTVSTTVRQTVTLRLENAIITGIEAGANLQGQVAFGQEQVTLIYQRLLMTTPIIDAKGVITGTSRVCLDVVNNRLC